MKKVVLLSGGIDSSTCLGLAREETEGHNILALNCYYGQKNKREMESAKKIADYYGVEYMEFDLSEAFKKSNCTMLSHSTEAIEGTAYSEQTSKSGGKPIGSYVPFRNGVMLSTAVAVAYSIGASEVWYGAHADDAEGGAYPDCSNAFVTAMNIAAIEGTGGAVSIKAPLKDMWKKDVVATGTKIKVPYHMTWSCYESGEHPCGKCGTCRQIQDAFSKNGLEYPVK